MALGSTLSQVIVPQYFLKYRATASGFSLSGPCLGSFFLPIVLEYMLTNLGLTGTFLLSGGIVMHVLPASIVMVEPPWIKRKFKQGESHLNVKSLNDLDKSHMTNVVNQRVIECTGDIREESVHNLKMVSTFKNTEKGTNLAMIVNGTSNGNDNPAFVGSQMDLTDIKSNQV